MIPATEPDISFWQKRFEEGQTGWDRGGPNPQLLVWLDTGTLAPCRIAVPGCGSGWEVAELARRGFDVTGIDYTPAAVQRANAKLDAFGLKARIIQADVLQWRPDVQLDALYEQTCLCALPPRHWIEYSRQLHRWLRPEGSLWAMFMQVRRPEAESAGGVEGPPFHCDLTAMHAVFASPQWEWSEPPHAIVPHPSGWQERAVRLLRR